MCDADFTVKKKGGGEGRRGSVLAVIGRETLVSQL